MRIAKSEDQIGEQDSLSFFKFAKILINTGVELFDTIDTILFLSQIDPDVITVRQTPFEFVTSAKRAILMMGMN